MYFDTHAHYCDKRFDEDRDELIGSMPAGGVSLILNAGSNLKSSKMSVELAERFPFVYAAVGIHPHDVKSMTDDTMNELEEMHSHPKVMAVGEIGLDYHYDFSPRDVQKVRFCEQMEFARKINKPVIVHEREALNDVLDTIREYKDLTGVMHCFSGSWETAKIVLDMGWYLSFSGVITFKNARKALEVIEKMPADRILIETDCPYLAPDPMRGKRNSSLYLQYIAAKIAEVRYISIDEVADVTTKNGKRFFGI